MTPLMYVAAPFTSHPIQRRYLNALIVAKADVNASAASGDTAVDIGTHTRIGTQRTLAELVARSVTEQ